MKRVSRHVEPDQLGVIGKDAFAERLIRDLSVAPASFRYARTAMWIAGTSVPVLLEVAFGTFDPVRIENDPEVATRRLVLTSVNWSPTLDQAFPSLEQALSEANVQPGDPAVIAVHLALPRVSFADRGKTRLTVDVSTVLSNAVRQVAKHWTKAKRQRLQIANADLRRLATPRAKKLSITDACFQVMEAAYLKASADGRLPVKGRQIMYAARPLVMDLTGGEFFKPGTQTFQQQTLISFMEQNPELTSSWNAVWDDRGHFREPHTGKRIGLGTLGVRRYSATWTDGEISDFRADVLAALDGARLIPTVGPRARFGAVLFIEKEGFDELFDAVQLGLRYDLAIMSSKGMSTTATRELVDVLSQAATPIFVLHDLDKAGLSIAHTLRTDSRRCHFQQAPRVVDLGLRLEDVRALSLESLAEDVEYRSTKDPRENLALRGQCQTRWTSWSADSAAQFGSVGAWS